MNIRRRSPTRGQTLLEVVIIAGIAAVIAASLGKLFSNSFKMKNALESDVELIALKQNLIGNLSCSETLTTGILASCNASNYIALKNKAGAMITGPLVTPSTSIFKGAGRLGNYYLRAYCDNANTTIVVQVAKPALNNNSFDTDPIAKTALDFSNPRLNPVYGPTTGAAPHNTPLCQASFGGTTASCAAGNYITDVDFVHQAFTCSANANAGLCTGTPNGVVQNINWQTQTVTCKSAPTTGACPAGNYVTGYDSSGNPLCGNPTAGPPISPPCSPGYYITWVDFSSKQWICSTTPNSNLCSAPNSVVTNVNFTTGSVSCGNLATSTTCGAGYYSVGTNSANQAICQPMPTSATVAGDCFAAKKVVGAIQTNGTVVCVNPLVNASTPICPLGQFAFANTPDGSPACAGPAGAASFNFKTSNVFTLVGGPQVNCGILEPAPGYVRAQYLSQVQCDPGFAAIGGSVDCQQTPPGGGVISSGMIGPFFTGVCCVYVPGSTSGGYISGMPPTVTEGVTAACMRQ